MLASTTGGDGAEGRGSGDAAARGEVECVALEVGDTRAVGIGGGAGDGAVGQIGAGEVGRAPGRVRAGRSGDDGESGGVARGGAEGVGGDATGPVVGHRRRSILDAKARGLDSDVGRAFGEVGLGGAGFGRALPAVSRRGPAGGCDGEGGGRAGGDLPLAPCESARSSIPCPTPSEPAPSKGAASEPADDRRGRGRQVRRSDRVPPGRSPARPMRSRGD